MKSGALRDSFEETRLILEAMRPLSYPKLAACLGYDRSQIGMLSDVLHLRYEHVSAAKLNDLRQRLQLPPIPPTIPAIPCPSCNVVHGSGLDCHGIAGQVAIIPAGARIITPSTRKRPPYKRPTWAMVRALEARIRELEEQSHDR